MRHINTTSLTLRTRQFSTSCSLRRAFQAGDVVLLRDKKDASHEGNLVTLAPKKQSHTHRGVIEHSDIIGKQSRQVVRSTKGSHYRIHEPTLAEYVRLTPRLVTPIYPSDANLIVSLLDIHVDHPGPGPDDSHKLEILEAGTGHGALTLHLSRAIHAANPPVPKSPATTQGESEPEEAIYNGESVSDLHESNLDAWKAGRRAIVHTLDISSKHFKHAKKIVRGFRHGIYAENVDFHEGDVSDWIASQKVVRQTDEPFISHVFLDLPNAGQHLENAASVLRVNGQLAIFNPSITQIVECVERIREHKMPYLLEQVVELGAGNIREWDVRAVRPRASLRKAESSPVRKQEVDPASLDTVEEQQARDDETSSALSQEKEEWAMICRPKVGAQVVGGGFLALWRKMEPAQNIDPIE